MELYPEFVYNILYNIVFSLYLNQNRQDIDIAAFTYNDAKYIRKEIQINNEEMYFLYIYLLHLVLFLHNQYFYLFLSFHISY